MIKLSCIALREAAATVLRGIMGYGATSRLHTAKILRLSEDLPLVIDIVDTQEKLDPLPPFLDEAVETGMVTTETVHVVHYRPGGQPEAAE